ncbi:MAG: tRNA (adenosine(37)-N6)-dimethylallyltransferase MiaA [Dethiobacter sp.]|jgi:tRNA dimethylallyltransferase|nr:tRNA (adenosine(37)-N6)-dimethylallyltransferase MiaA [Dethiobacter sp.]
MGELVVIVGPTAVGKSDAAIHVAQKMGGEIVSADSVQVFRGLDIGTAKPSLAEQMSVPHHMIDVAEPNQDYTVADFQRDARAVIADIHKRKRLPILVGGSGLYVRSVVQNYSFTASGQNNDIRRSLSESAKQYGLLCLYQKLQEVDPLTATKVHPRDQRRIIRALEVYEQNRRPLSEQIEKTRSSASRYRLFMYGLTMPRQLLYQKIEERTDKMIAAGLVDEVKRLLAEGCSPSDKALTSIGYRHIVSFLRGESTFEQAVQLLKRDTRRFAKRQLTWFARDSEITWFDVSAAGGAGAAAENICNLLAGYYQLK